MATHSSVVAREIHRQWSLAATVHGVAESDQATKHWLFGLKRLGRSKTKGQQGDEAVFSPGHTPSKSRGCRLRWQRRQKQT